MWPYVATLIQQSDALEGLYVHLKGLVIQQPSKGKVYIHPDWFAGKQQDVVQSSVSLALFWNGKCNYVQKKHFTW